MVARAAFPRGNRYLRLRDAFGPVFTGQQFATLFPSRGQPAEAPWRLALATLLQFAETLPDRRAADAARSRIDWKHPPGLELADPGFDVPGMRRGDWTRWPRAACSHDGAKRASRAARGSRGLLLRQAWMQNVLWAPVKAGEQQDVDSPGEGGLLVRWRTPVEGLPTSLQRVAPPYDHEAHDAKKRWRKPFGFRRGHLDRRQGPPD